MPYRAHFRCFAGCPGTFPLTEAIYRCPTCDGLLEVHHDIDALRDKKASEWRSIFDLRYRGHEFPYGSGVWGKREWIAPQVPDDHIVSTYEGATNLFHARRLGAEIGVPELYVKQCGNAHTLRANGYKVKGRGREKKEPTTARIARAAIRSGFSWCRLSGTSGCSPW